jgi:hypothetical protein
MNREQELFLPSFNLPEVKLLFILNQQWYSSVPPYIFKGILNMFSYVNHHAGGHT